MFLALAVFSVPQMAAAHCDTLDGPVLVEAQKALDTNKIAPLLKWIPKNDEATIKQAFEKAVKVRKQSESAKELADMYFFETLIRIHRAGEGVGYTGIKPSGSVSPAIKKADQALETGNIEPLAKMIGQKVEEAILSHYHAAEKAQKTKDSSTEAGREFVEAYVKYVHFVEGIHESLTASGNSEHKH